MKLAIIGGGSFFTATIAHGIAHVAQKNGWPTDDLEVALFDVDPARAQLMADYGKLLVRRGLLAARFTMSQQRAEALDGADVVIESVPFREENEQARKLREAFGVPETHQGPGAIPAFLACMPFMRRLAQDMERYCPDALLLLLTNPTDMFADAISRATEIAACGLCVEVYHLIDHLAFYFGWDPDEIQLHTVGVNHAGWSLRFFVGEEDGYELIRGRMAALPEHPDFHPGNMLLVEAYQLTGYLRSSAFHPWPYRPSEPPLSWEEFHRRRRVVRGRTMLELVRQALKRGEPLSGPEDRPPELIEVRYRGTGRGVGRLLYARDTGAEQVLTLQLRNGGAAEGWEPDFYLELAVRAAGRVLRPIALGRPPEWLVGFEKALALHNKLAVDYYFDRNLNTLKQALAAVQLVAGTGALNSFAQAVHERFADSPQ